MIESQVTCVEESAHRDQKQLQASEFAAENIQTPATSGKNEAEGKEGDEKIRENMFGVDGEFFDSMI